MDDQHFDRIEKRLDDMVAEIRHGHVLMEKIQSTVELTVEGIQAVNERLDGFMAHAEQQRAQDKAENNDGFRALQRRDDQLDVRVTRLEEAVFQGGGT